MEQSKMSILKDTTVEAKRQATDNLEKLYTRGIELDDLEENALSLQETTKQVLSDAKELDWAAFWRKYQMWIIIWSIIIIYLLDKIFF